MYVVPNIDMSPSALIMRIEAQSTDAEGRARDAAHTLGCQMQTFRRVEGPGDIDAVFVCERGNKTLRIKAHLGDAMALATWQEPYYASLAAYAGYAAPVVPAPNTLGILASVAQDAAPLGMQAMRAAEVDLVALVYAVHHHVLPMPRTDLQPEHPCAVALHKLDDAVARDALSAAAAQQLRDRLMWLEGQLRPLQTSSVLINGNVRPGFVSRQDGSLILDDWSGARMADPYVDLIVMASALRVSNARSRAYLAAYHALQRLGPSPTEQRRFALLQAVHHIEAYVSVLIDLGPSHPEARLSQRRFVEDASDLWDMPPLNIAMLPATTCSRAFPIADADAGRAVTLDFAHAMLPGDTKLSEPIAQKDAFFFFRAKSASQDWFIKVSQGGLDAAPWLEPQWAAWAADHDLAPRVQADAGHDGYGRLLATEWLEGTHLDGRTANRPAVRKAVLTQMRRLHSLAAPSLLAPPKPEEKLTYTGGAWGRYHEMLAQNKQAPVRLDVMHAALVRAEAELASYPVRRVVCHNDLLPRNIFYVNGQALFVDWDWTGYSDPFSDIAKFFALGNIQYDDVEASLAIYLDRPAEPQELRRLLLIMLVLELDFYGANQADTHPSHPAVIGRARRATQAHALLYPGEPNILP